VLQRRQVRSSDSLLWTGRVWRPWSYAVRAGHRAILEHRPFEISLYYDNLSALLLLLVSFLTAVITRYSQNYLDGDPQHGRFTKWLCLTAGSVQVLVIAGNLLVFALAWSAVSFCLHKLLISILTVRERYWPLVKNLSSVVWAIFAFGNADPRLPKVSDLGFSRTFSAGEHRVGDRTGRLYDHQLLLVATALLKSAQFPP